MQMIDITMPICPGMPVWPGDEPPRQHWNERITDGGAADVSHWVLGSHTGTHIDSPSHFLAGAAHIDELELARVMGVCEVVDVDDQGGLVTRECLDDAWPPRRSCHRLLLRTRNSRQPRRLNVFDRAFVALDVTGAQTLIDRAVETVGVDYLSVERYVDEEAEPDYDYPVHHRLLRAGVTIIEGLDLSMASPGSYRLWCLPLRLAGSEAAPARAVLAPLSEDPFQNEGE
jgi:arylformamidase